MRSSLMESHPASSVNPRRSTPGQHSSHSPTPVAQTQRSFSLVPLEGWLPLLLLSIAVYSVVYSVTAAITISHSTVLWITTALGLLGGLIVSKNRWLPQALLHFISCLVGFWLALLLTSTVAFQDSIGELLGALHAVILNGFVLTGTQTSEMVFLFYLSFLCFFLGYFGSWLIYRAHLPWLVALVYVSIMLVNLNYITKRDLSLLVVILVGALILLIARVQLANQVTQWKTDGLYTDRSWMRGMAARFLQIASLFLLLILPFSWFLPVINQPASGVTFWNNLDNAWANISHGNISALSNPQTLFNPYTPPNNFFGSQLTITGTVNLPNGPVLNYTSSVPTQGQYLEGSTYDTFDGHTVWNSQASGATQAYPASTELPLDNASANTKQVITSVTVLQPPDGDKTYIFGPPQPSNFSVPVTLLSNDENTFVTAWTQTQQMTKGERYQVTSQESNSSPNDLAAIPLPANAPDIWQSDNSYSSSKHYYLQLPGNISSEVRSKALLWTNDANNTYAAVADLQAHLSNTKDFTYSTSNDIIPSNIDIVTWLLRTHKGYCTYYASAMIVMARLLGIPARMVNGFSQGHFDAANNLWVVDGSDAHSWVQIYFPNLGWINFDPTPGFAGNSSVTPTPSVTPGVTRTQTPTTAHATVTPTTHKPGSQPTPITGQSDGTGNAVGNDNGQNLFLMASLLILLGALIIFALALKRYRSRDVEHTPVTSIYTRLCRIAGLVGSPPAQWQTPYEYTFTLSQRFPQAATTLRRLADLFVRERWAGPQQAPATNEERDLEQSWPRLRNTLLRSPFSKGRQNNH